MWSFAQVQAYLTDVLVTGENEIFYKSSYMITPTHENTILFLHIVEGLRAQRDLGSTSKNLFIIQYFEMNMKCPSYYVDLVKIKETMMLTHHVFGK